MGYASSALLQVAKLLRTRHPSSGQLCVLELGAQEINHDVPPSAILRFIYQLNPDFRHAERIIKLLPGCFAAPIFRAANIRYSCIDLFDSDGVIQIDLNVRELPADHRGKI
jgi:hypothetical protein